MTPPGAISLQKEEKDLLRKSRTAELQRGQALPASVGPGGFPPGPPWRASLTLRAGRQEAGR